MASTVQSENLHDPAAASQSTEVEAEPELPTEYCDIALSNRFVREHGDGLLHLAKAA